MPYRAVLEAEHLTKVFRSPGRQQSQTVAVRDVSFSLNQGEVMALVGESGSGKTTIGRMLAGIETPTSGTIRLHEADGQNTRGRLETQQRVQMVFQDPYAALNPFNPISYTLSRPLINYHHLTPAAARERARHLLETVQLTPGTEYIDKRPHQLSGGQRQRVVVARALAAGPEVIIADEPVSMLDVSIRADILRLLGHLLEDESVRSMLYITHDLLSARLLATRMMVLYRGHVVEMGRAEKVLQDLGHPYTRLLWSAIPNPHRAVRGETEPVPVASQGSPPPSGCPFAPRCPLVQDVCWHEVPHLAPFGEDHLVACHVVAPEKTASAS